MSFENYQEIDEENIPGAGAPEKRDIQIPPAIQRLDKAYWQWEASLAAPAQRWRGRARTLQEQAAQKKQAGKDVKAGILFSASVATSLITGFYEGITYRVRPEAIRQTPKRLIALTDPKIQKAIMRDPIPFFAELGGAAAGSAFFKRSMGRTPRVKDPFGRKPVKEPTVKTDPQIGVNPASKIATGKWPKQWKLETRRASAILMPQTLKRLDALKEMNMPGAFRYVGVLGGLGAMSPGRQTLKVEAAPKLKPPKTTPRLTTKTILDPRVIPKPKSKSKERERFIPSFRQRPILRPPVVGPTWVQIYGYRQRSRVQPITKIEPIQTQKQKQIQTQVTFTMPRLTQRAIKDPYVQPRRRKKKRRGGVDLFTFGEMREYGVKGVDKILKDLGI